MAKSVDLHAFAISGFDDLTISSDDNGVTIDLTEYGGGTTLLHGIGIDDLGATQIMYEKQEGSAWRPMEAPGDPSMKHE